MNTELHVPQHISIYGVYTSSFVLFSSIICSYFGYYILQYLTMGLYITSVLHWYKLQNGIVRKIDILFSVLTISHVTFVDSLYFLPKYRTLWLYVIGSSMFVYACNDIIFKYQIIYKPDLIDYDNKKPYKYISLDYTIPGTKNRELSFIYTSFSHIFMFHICSTITLMYGMINTHITEHTIPLFNSTNIQ